MKKNLHVFLSAFFMLLFTINAFAVDVRQTWTWTGAAGDNLWSNGSNWSASPVDVHQSFPRNFNDALNNKNFIADVVFNGSATPSIIATYFVNSLAINSGTVNLVSSGATKTFYIS